MKPITIAPEFQAILNSGRLDRFTVMELRDAYLEQCAEKPESPQKVRHLVYRTVNKLLKRGLLEKISSVADEKPRYRVTGDFSASLENSLTTPTRLSPSKPDNVKRGLQEKLHRYKLEMLSAMGEAEEYDAICNELPEMRRDIQPLYDRARDHCSKTLGRVRALELIISQHQNT